MLFLPAVPEISAILFLHLEYRHQGTNFQSLLKIPRYLVRKDGFQDIPVHETVCVWLYTV